MTDDLIARLRMKSPPRVGVKEVADALEAQARRIAELQQQVCSLIRRDPDDDKDARIAELEAALNDAAELLSDAYAEIGRREYLLGCRAARAAYMGEKE